MNYRKRIVGIMLSILMIFMTIGVAPVFATNEFDELVAEVEALPDFPDPSASVAFVLRSHPISVSLSCVPV